MSIPPAHPAFPCDLDGLLDAGVAESLTTLEVGALYRLVRFAWRQDPPCSLPAEEASLAMVARVTDEEWSRMRPRLLLALAATHTAPPQAGGSTGRLLLGHTRRVYDRLASKAAATAATKRAAGRAGAMARWQADGTCQAPAKHVPPLAIAAPSLRSPSSDSAPPLRRSSPSGLNPSARAPESFEEGSSAGARAPALVARLGRAAAMDLDAQVALWRRRQCLIILERAIEAWRAAKLTTCPTSKAQELADGEYSTPARVQSLLEEIADGLKREKNRIRNPVAVLIGGLGLGEHAPARPAPVPMLVEDAWQKRETAERARLGALASAQDALDAARLRAAGRAGGGVGRA